MIDDVETEAEPLDIADAEPLEHDQAAEPKAPPTLDETVRAAFDKHAKPEDKEPGKPAAKPPIVTHKPPLKVEVKSHTRVLRPGDKAPPAEVKQEVVEKPLKTPDGWTAAEREHWKSLPPDAQKAVLRSERAATIAIQKSKEEAAPLKKFVGMFSEAVKPYASVINAEGSNPVHAFTEYLRTATVLRQGSPQAKAQLIAGYVHQFGVSVDELADAIEAKATGKAPAGQPGAQPTQQFDPTAFAAEMEKRLEAKLAQREQQSRISSEHDSVEKFGADKEFFRDVRKKMANIVELHLADQREVPEDEQVALDLEEVYDMACRLTPGVAELYSQRLAAKKAGEANTSTQAAKRASSSIRNRPSGIREVKQRRSKDDIGADVEAAYDALTGG